MYLRRRPAQARRRRAGGRRDAEEEQGRLRLRHHLVQRDDGGRAGGHRRGHTSWSAPTPARARSPAASATSSTSPPRGTTTRRPRRMGKYLQDQGINDLYVMAPNYQAGKDMVTGLKRYYKGRIVDEVYTKLGQQDYQAEITAAAREEPEGGVRVLSRRHGHPVPQAVRRRRACATRSRSTPSTRWTRPRSRRSRTPRSATTRRATGART